MYKVMGLDIGTKRIGVALSDYLLVTANGHSCVERNADAPEKIRQIALENNVEKIVAGLPFNMDGTRGAQAQDCMDFASQISGFEIIYEDERLTSEEAEERLRGRKVDFRKNKSLVDIESACVILEQYLNRGEQK
jgi:putative Holliday junction resolvase